MSDIIDVATAIEQRQLDRAVHAARAPIPEGAPGECDGCERQMPRLVGGLCGFCRDGRSR